MHDNPAEIRDLQEAWETILPDGVMTRTLIVADYCHQLTQAEIGHISNASERRKIEFSTSRTAIRDLIKKQCEAWEGVIPDSQHMPVWPTGWTGSISHTREICAVAVARKQHIRSIGIDIESRNRLKRSLWRKIATVDELQQIEAYATNAPCSIDDLMTLVFSIKEAIYKYQFPATSQWLGFLDVRLSFETDGFVRASLVSNRSTDMIRGADIAYQITSDHVISAVYRRAGD
jgi:4'-phosphopantetheinyl transferase EntD